MNPLPIYSPEELERFWRGEEGEEPILPTPDAHISRAERNRLGCMARYWADPDGERARARRYYEAHRAAVLARTKDYKRRRRA